MEGSLILIGTVSSTLVPLKDLKVFVVEEEDSKVYKVKRTPKFDIKRVAYYIHKEKKVPVILSSSIPSLESFLSLKNGQINPITNTNPIIIKNLKILPHININEDLFKIKDTVLKSEETLIVANKGYYSSLLFCERCGWEANCQECGFHLSVHMEGGKKYLECGRCKAKYKYISICPECDFKLSESGFGKEKVEIFLKKSIPQNCWNKFKVISSVELKALTIGKYQTVINVYPDFLLELPDFRAKEYFVRKVFLPLTVCKENYIIISNQQKEIQRYIKNNTVNIRSFLENELQRRKQLELPPIIKTIKLEVKEKISDSLVLDFFKNLNLLKKDVSENTALYIFEYKKEEEKTLFKEFYKKYSQKFKISIEVNPINF
jgi:primosomal protein N' (replication factor Y)